MDNSLLKTAFNILDSEKPKTFRQLVEEKKTELRIGSDHELSKMVGIPINTLTRLLDAQNQKADMFSVLKVSQYLGIDLTNMVEVYASSLKPEFVGQLDIAAKANYILRNFNLPVLKKLKFIKNVTDFEHIDKRITSFFGLSSIFLYSQDIISPVLFSKIKRYSDDDMQRLWTIGATAQFERLNNPNTYDADLLTSLIPKIRPYTRNEETGFIMVVRALYKIGVTVIVQKYLANTSIRGGTLLVNDKPCVVITDYKQNYSTLWFTLLHELYHVLSDYKELKTWGVHLSGEHTMFSDLFKEDKADEFAHERLFPKIKMDHIRSMIKSPAAVSDYAEKNNVHPGIIYSFYCYEEKIKNGKDCYALYQHYFGKSEPAVKLIKLNPFNDETESMWEGLDTIQRIYEYSSSENNK